MVPSWEFDRGSVRFGEPFAEITSENTVSKRHQELPFVCFKEVEGLYNNGP